MEGPWSELAVGKTGPKIAILRIFVETTERDMKEQVNKTGTTPKIIGIGETVLDVIFKNDQPQSATPGGSTFNSMISLGRVVRKAFPCDAAEQSGTSVKVLMVTEVGDDHIGSIVTKYMEDNGVSTEAVTRNHGTQTHLSMAFLDDQNNAQYEFYKNHAGASLDPEKVTGVQFGPDDIVLFGSFFAINPKIREFTLSLLKRARAAGSTIYYDINFRKSHIPDIPDVMENICENCRLSDFVRGSDEDFGYLFGTTDPERIYTEHIAPLCPNFICTCGSKPVHVFMKPEGISTAGSNQDGFLHQVFPIPAVEQVISTIGAGDNFNAGFVYGLLRAKLDASEQVVGQGIADLIALAGRFSANVCASISNNVDEDFATEIAKL